MEVSSSVGSRGRLLVPKSCGLWRFEPRVDTDDDWPLRMVVGLCPAIVSLVYFPKQKNGAV